MARLKALAAATGYRETSRVEDDRDRRQQHEGDHTKIQFEHAQVLAHIFLHGTSSTNRTWACSFNREYADPKAADKRTDIAQVTSNCDAKEAGRDAIQPSMRPAARRDGHDRADDYQCTSRCRIVAGLSGFFTLIQSRDGPDR